VLAGFAITGTYGEVPGEKVLVKRSPVPQPNPKPGGPSPVLVADPGSPSNLARRGAEETYGGGYSGGGGGGGKSEEIKHEGASGLIKISKVQDCPLMNDS
jgi:hypothetical protein